MKALRFHRTGSLDNLIVEEIARPEVGPGLVLIKVRAAALNPSDIKNVLGKMHETTTPRTPGRDFSGVVVQPAGTLKEGNEVFGSGGTLGFNVNGSHAEYVSVPVEAVRPKPENLDFNQSAAIGVPYLTAWKAIVLVAQLRPAESLLVTGSTGAVGSAAVRIAKTVPNVRVFGTVRRSGEGDSAGLTKVVDTWIDLSRGPVHEQVRAQTEGKGVSVVFDVVGGELFESCLRCLALGGRQVAISSSPDPEVRFNLVDFYHNESRSSRQNSNPLN